jgi:hypothetical protein
MGFMSQSRLRFDTEVHQQTALSDFKETTGVLHALYFISVSLPSDNTDSGVQGAQFRKMCFRNRRPKHFGKSDASRTRNDAVVQFGTIARRGNFWGPVHPRTIEWNEQPDCAFATILFIRTNCA